MGSQCLTSLNNLYRSTNNCGPTFAPTNSPTNAPTAPTNAPNNAPTSSPTNKAAYDSISFIRISIIGLGLVVIMVMVCMILLFKKRNKKIDNNQQFRKSIVDTPADNIYDDDQTANPSNHHVNVVDTKGNNDNYSTIDTEKNELIK